MKPRELKLDVRFDSLDYVEKCYLKNQVDSRVRYKVHNRIQQLKVRSIKHGSRR